MKTLLETLASGKRTYTSYDVKGKYTIMVVHVGNELDYVSVSKNMANTRRATLGKDFKSFDAAAQAYKDSDIKTALLMIETGQMKPISR